MERILKSVKSRMSYVPSPRVVKPKLLLAIAWIASLLLVYHCCRFVTYRVYIDIERALVPPKDSPPLLGYLLLLRFYAEKYTYPATKDSVTFLPGDVRKRMEHPKARCQLFNGARNIPNLTQTEPLQVTEICMHPHSSHLLTLFTTMYDREDKIFIFNNTVRNWSGLSSSGIKPVLFLTPAATTSAGFVAMVTGACNAGWDVVVAPHCNNDTYPVLRSMWHVAMHTWNSSTFYGFANGDMLFDATLPLTLNHLLKHDPHIFRRKHMIAGQRHNAHLERNHRMMSEDDVHTALYNTSLHSGLAIDYFISMATGLAWHAMPPFVIGRPQFDNWLIWTSAMDPAVMDIDATETILAMHQGVKGTISGWAETDVSVTFNNEIAKETEMFYVLHGCTYCMTYRLMNMITSILVVPRRLERRLYTCIVDGEEHIAFLQMRTEEALLTAYSKSVLTLDKEVVEIVRMKKKLPEPVNSS